MKTKILVNALSAQLGGGQTYLLQLFDPSLKIWDDYDIIFLVSEANASKFKAKFPNVINIGASGDHFFSRFIWENKHLNNLLKSESIHLLFAPGGLLPLFRAPVKTICVSQNMLPFSPDQIFESETLGQKIKLLFLRLLQGFSFKRASGMLFISQYASDVISKAVGPFKNVAVIPNGTSVEYLKPLKSPYEFSYALYVSTFFAYKHQIEVVKAFHQHLQKYPSPLKLILVGSNQNPYGRKVVRLIEDLKLNDHILMPANVPVHDLMALMKNSEVNIFASSCENCPIILLEYLAAGRPIICSNLEPMPEFGKNWVNYFSPYKHEELSIQLESVLIQNNIPEKMSTEEIKSLSWNQTAIKTKKFIETVLSH